MRVVHSTMAGQPASVLRQGEAVRIMTGAPIPTGADVVCVFEDNHEAFRRRLTSPATLAAGSSGRSRSGEDARLQAPPLMWPGTVFGPARNSVLLAAVGERTVLVHRQPVVGVLSTGDDSISDDARPQRRQDPRAATVLLCLPCFSRCGARESISVSSGTRTTNSSRGRRGYGHYELSF